MKNNRVLSLIGLATKAGKTVSGEFSTEKSVKTGKGLLVIVVEVILIIVVLIGLVIIFQTQIKKVVDSIFKTITSKTGQVK